MRMLLVSNKGVKVFGVTTVFSILAYLWLILVLMGTSKDVVCILTFIKIYFQDNYITL